MEKLMEVLSQIAGSINQIQLFLHAIVFLKMIDSCLEGL